MSSLKSTPPTQPADASLSVTESAADIARRHADAICALDDAALSHSESLRACKANADSYRSAKAAHEAAPTEATRTKLDASKAALKESTAKEKALETKMEESATKLRSKLHSVPPEVLLRSLKIFHDARENKRIEDVLKWAQTLDLCFVFDATGSMAMEGVFKAIKMHIRSILTKVKASSAHMKQQLALVAFRDPEDGAAHFEVQPMTGSVSAFETAVASVKAFGGGDQCEDVIGALEKASEMEWTYENRLLFLCGDAPCHGESYHDGCNDSHLGGLGKLSEAILHKLIAKKVQIFFWRINRTTDKMICKFNEECARFNGPFPTDRPRDQYISVVEVDVSSAASIADSITKGVSESVSRSMSGSASRAGSIRHRDIEHSTSRLASKLGAIPEEEEDSTSTSSTSDGSLSAGKERI